MAFVAHIDGELAGVLEVKLHENKNFLEYENWIGGVFTNPKHRSQGIATKLINKAKEFAKKAGMPQLYLQCESFNVELYLNQGFKPLHQARHHEVATTIMVWEATT
ncbi:MULTISPECIES: GNAT family N-acetyltransferase [Vibrio]|uniref:GNAT family N-acetyltransferase n=1 Tax=Vibrio TaxID=662 RepID=UPI002074AD8A|nr:MULTISPECIES: GNAT family N-acetyltransferase [Vibrio]